MILFTMLQAAATAQQGGSQLSFWIMIILVFAVMWFFMIRPQRKQQKEIEKFRNELKKGDKVVTDGGIYGTILEVQDKCTHAAATPSRHDIIPHTHHAS